MRAPGISFLTCIAVLLVCGAAATDDCKPTFGGNLGYNSYEGYMSRGQGLRHYFGPGVGYQNDSGDQFRRYFPREDWGKYGYGTGHMGMGYGPYIYSPREGGPPAGLFDPLEPAYKDAPPPSIKVRDGNIRVAFPSNIPGIACVTVTVVAFNNAELLTQSMQGPPYVFNFPVVDGVKSVRVRIDYRDSGMSATSYRL